MLSVAVASLAVGVVAVTVVVAVAVAAAVIAALAVSALLVMTVIAMTALAAVLTVAAAFAAVVPGRTAVVPAGGVAVAAALLVPLGRLDGGLDLGLAGLPVAVAGLGLLLSGSLDAFLHQLIVQNPLVQIGILHPDLHGVAETIDLAGALSDYAVMLLVKLIEIAPDVAQRDHSLDIGGLDLHIHSPVRET